MDFYAHLLETRKHVEDKLEESEKSLMNKILNLKNFIKERKKH